MSSPAIDLYTDFVKHLVLSYVLQAKSGDFVNVGEEFTMRFTVTNTFGLVPHPPFPTPLHPFRPNVVYNRVHLRVVATAYATPKAGASVDLPFPDTALAPREHSQLDVPMKALQAMAGTSPELVANAWVTGSVDCAKYLALEKKCGVYQQIEPS